MSNSEHINTTETKLKRIGELSKGDPNIRFNNLMHLYNTESLTKCFNKLDRKKAVGIDKVTKEEYGNKLSENIEDLLDRMKRMAYRPGPVREVLIPKEGKPGATRPLGIANTEDKIVQNMTREILESIYEPLFLNCSYGFRPGRSCHKAIRDLKDHLFRNDVKVIIDVDLKNFFGTIDLKSLQSFLEEKITDKKFIRYIVRMFKAGVLSDGELKMSEEGVPQGSSCSPVLSNITAHHVIDQWFQETVKVHCYGTVAMFRYADDIVICCNDERDGSRIKKALSKRLNKYGLEMNMDKTKLIPFSKAKQGEGIKQGTFDFLGFTFYLGKSQRGFVIPKLKTSGKRMRSKLKRVNDWIKKRRNLYRLNELWKTLCKKLQGHINYYGVSFNQSGVRKFVTESTRIFFKWINRRSQRRSFTWDKFTRFMERFPLPQNTTKVTLYSLSQQTE